MKTIIEPFRIKVVEPMKLTTREQRRQFILDADLNPFRLKADSVLIDLLTDSGTSAMSIYQWAGIMRGDESYAGGRSFDRFEASVRNIFGHEFVIPTHQGRAAERLLCDAAVTSESVVPGNTHFDTTRANIENSGAEAVDIPIAEAKDPSNLHPFKGNIDLELLEACLTRNVGRVPFVLITITNNSAGGQPVSLANIKAARAICDQHLVPLFLDAARFAENAWFIKMREEGQRHRSATDIAREVFSYSDGALMSMKKDAFGNIGGVLSLNSKDWASKIRTNLILTEGFPTYGGLAGRDLEALAIGLEEVLEEDYLEYRIRSTAYVGEHLAKAGVPLVQPFGGHAIYLDGRRFCDHLTNEMFPGWALSVALYEELGVRACEIGNVMFGHDDPKTGEWCWPDLDLVRLAIPRRVYTQSHMDYVIEGITELYEKRHLIRGLRVTDMPEVLPHFSARFAFLEGDSKAHRMA